MYMELDGDDVAVTYIKDVIFNVNRKDVETLRMIKVSSETHMTNRVLLHAEWCLCFWLNWLHYI